RTKVLEWRVIRRHPMGRYFRYNGLWIRDPRVDRCALHAKRVENRTAIINGTVATKRTDSTVQPHNDLAGVAQIEEFVLSGVLANLGQRRRISPRTVGF